MCVFCAAVPATVALGAAAKAKQKNASDAQSLPDWMLALPAEKVAMLVIAGLIAGSVTYHSQISPV